MGEIQSAWHFVLEHGTEFDSTTPFDEEEQKIIKAVRGRMKFPLGKCYRNAQRIVTGDFYGSELVRDIQYVEGVVVPSYIYHAWLLLRGKVLDLTWSDREDYRYIGVVVPAELVLK